MSVQPRPIDTITVDFLQLGMPFIEFAPALQSGAFGPFRNLGIVDTAEVAKTIELATLRSAQSGVSVKVRELVRQFDAQLNVGLFQHSPENMQFMFGSESLVDVVANPAASVVGDPFRLTDEPQDFLDLGNQLVDEATVVVTADSIIDEAVGVGAGGTFGETQGDFALDFKIFAIGDVSSYIERLGGVDTERVTDLVAGGAPMAGEIGIIIGSGATGGEITYPGGEAPASGTQIIVDYEPTFTTTLNTDFSTDPIPGRIRLFDFNGGSDPFRNFQPMEADYDHVLVAHDELKPYTQFVFSGKTRVRLLTDVGINIIWDIPSSSVRLTDDAFVFNRDEFQITPLIIDILDAGGSARFGTLQLFPETP